MQNNTISILYVVFPPRSRLPKLEEHEIIVWHIENCDLIIRGGIWRSGDEHPIQTLEVQ